MPRAGLTADGVIAAGARMLDAQRDETLNIAALAESLGVRPPSLYKHVDGLAGLKRGIMLRAKADLAEVLGRAAVGKAGSDALRALGRAYREWAESHPAQYKMTVRAPVPGDADDEAVSEALVALLYRVVEGYGIEGDDLVDATRFVRAALHGFVDLETDTAFALPVATERSFQRLLGSLTTALSEWQRS